MSEYITVDFSKTLRGHIVKYENKGEVWYLGGECKRCGECCQSANMPLKEIANKKGKCKKLEFETQNGVKMAKCTAPYESRPAFCFLYPRDPYAKLNKKCGFFWKRAK